MTSSPDAAASSVDSWRDHPSYGAVPPLELLNGDLECRRLVVVAAHPDDESLGAGGLIHRAHRQGLDIYVVLLTAGEASHPLASVTSRRELATRRLGEMDQALRELAPGSPLVFLGVPDGEVASAEEQMTASLVEVIGDGQRTALVAPWRHDGLPDHDAAGRAAAAAARRTGALLVEYPIWYWNRGSPHEAPWERMRRIDLEDVDVRAKWSAVQAHASQTDRPSPAEGEEVLLHRRVLGHYCGEVEHFVVDEPADDPALDRLQEVDEDPWGVETRWYEQRKRALTLAALPRQRFRRALEVGCSRGALAAELATRCDEVVAVDSSPAAVRTARTRLADVPAVRVEQQLVPDGWPSGRFDLVVVSEVGYFLSPRDLDRLIARIASSLDEDGIVVLCHWRHPVQGWVLRGGEVHERFQQGSLPPTVATYRDRDVEIAVLCPPIHWPDPAG